MTVPGVLALMWTTPLPLQADTIELTDGSKIIVEEPRFKDGKLVLEGGRKIPRAEISRILLEHGDAPGATAPVAAGADIQALLRTATAAREKYPDVGAIMLIDDGELILRPDGTQWERAHSAFLILKEDWLGMAEIGHAFEEGRERVTLVRARTISEDGTVHDFDPADLLESKLIDDATAFAEYKTLSGQLPQVSVGSIVEVVWDVETYNPYDKELFFPGWYFGSTEPSMWSRITVRIPLSRTLYYRTDNMPPEAAEPIVTETGEERVYRWEMHDIAHFVPEPAMPPMAEVIPRVNASIHENWEYLFDFLGKFQREHIETTAPIKQRALAIVEDCTTAEEKVGRLYHWLQQEIRYISIKGSMGSGWSGHPASATLANGYGDCIDQAILFASLLRAVDITAYPVILSTNDEADLDRSLPNLHGNHAITKIYLGEKPMYLDTTGETFRYPYFRPDDHGVTTINVLEREIGFVSVPPADDNRLDLALDLTLDARGNVEADVRLTMNGAFEAGLRTGLQQINKFLLKQAAQAIVNQISPGAALKTVDASDAADLTVPLAVTMKVSFPEYPQFAGDLMIFHIPLSEVIHRAPEASLDERTFDIDYTTSGSVTRSVRLELPGGYVVKGLPDAVRLATPYAAYEGGYRLDGDTVMFEDSFRTERPVIPRDDYSAHKEFREKVVDFARKPLFLYKARTDPT